jgi:hypothetical protein
MYKPHPNSNRLLGDTKQISCWGKELLHFTSLSRTFLLVGVESLQRAFRLTQSRAIALIPFHLIPLFFKIFFSPSYQVVGFFFWASQSCVLACLSIFDYLFPPILVTCPNDINCANSSIPEREICSESRYIKCSRLGDLSLGIFAPQILGFTFNVLKCKMYQHFLLKTT